jgi:hypothetical protein
MDYNQSNRPSPESFLKSISIIHLALLAGQVIFAIVAYAQSVKVYFGIHYMDDVFMYIVPLAAIGGFMTGYTIFKKQLAAIRSKNTLGEKIIAYQTALIIRYALLEGPCLLAIVAYLLNNNLFYLVVAGLLILYFIFLRPTMEKVENDLDLNFNEKIEFLGEDEVIK